MIGKPGDGFVVDRRTIQFNALNFFGHVRKIFAKRAAAASRPLRHAPYRHAFEFR